ncbi:hypothetical protein [Lentisphaera araneosa]|uniref:hypothetical protein n=1 Tax=Lentisphaera araneosa TaxID=256847 RepID=UPI0013896B5F|nr:hypothetical protein [Lentisphaera araneosa]
MEFNAHRNGSKSHVPQFIPFNQPVWQYLPAGVRRINLLFYLKFWDSVPIPARYCRMGKYFLSPVWQYLSAGVRRINILFDLKSWNSVPFPAYTTVWANTFYRPYGKLH